MVRKSIITKESAGLKPAEPKKKSRIAILQERIEALEKENEKLIDERESIIKKAREEALIEHLGHLPRTDAYA